jgi:phospholipase C
MSMNDIEHVVVLMLENRSFDHFLGDLSIAHGRADVDGVQAGMSNPTSFGAPAQVAEVATERFLTDGGHSFEDVQKQLAARDGKPNQGFVINYETKFDTPDKKRRLAPEIMRYQTAATVPVLYALADEYALSDRWFCSVPSETWPNRIFANAATTQGRLKNGLPLYKLDTVFDRLAAQGQRWAVYNDQIPNLINIRHLAGEWLRSRHKPNSRFRSMQQFEEDCRDVQLPQYSWIEPIYFFGGANDDHPPHDIMKGQELIARVYLAIRRNDDVWKKTLLLITYDEHGGFFDHVPPLKGANIPAPDAHVSTNPPFDFKQLGVRVPLLAISPWVARQKVIRPPSANEFFDHTSLIRTVSVKWNLAPLTNRDAAAKDLWFALEAQPRFDDVATFAKIEAWSGGARGVLAAEGALDAGAMVGDDAHNVAAIIAAQRATGVLEAEGVPQSEFQVSMEDLAAAVLAESSELQAEAEEKV